MGEEKVQVTLRKNEEKQVKFGKYTLVEVYGNLSLEEQAEIISLWKRYKVIPLKEIPKRISQVFFLIRNEKDEIVGVNSIEYKKFPFLGVKGFSYRIFIKPEERGNFLFVFFIFQKTFERLKEYVLVNNIEADGVIVVMENPGFYQRGVKRYLLERVKLKYLGKNLDGLDVWIKEFKV